MKKDIITNFTSCRLVHDAWPFTQHTTHSMRPQRDIVLSGDGAVPSRNDLWLFCVASHRIPTIMTQQRYVRRRRTTSFGSVIGMGSPR